MRESTLWASQGGPIIGEIKNGKKYPFGTVPATEYDADMQVLHTEIAGLNSAVVACQGNLAGLTSALDTLSGQYGATVPGLSESVSALRVQIGDVSAALTAATQTLTAGISEVDTKVDSLDTSYGTRLTAAESGITRLSAETAQNAQDIASQAGRITAAETGLQNLAAESARNTQDIATQSGNITVLTGRVDTLAAKEAGDVETLTGRLDTAASDLRSTQITVRDHTTSINALTTTTGHLNDTVESLGSSVDRHAAAIETLQAAAGALSSDLGAVTDLATATSATTAANSEAITGIRDAITQMRASITANATAINAFNAAITELTSTQNVDRATLTARIQAAENSVTALSNTVDSMGTTLSNQISGLRAGMTVNSQDIAVIKSTLQIQGAAVESVENRCTAVENRMNSQEVGMATLRQQLLNSVMNIENEIEQVVTDKAAIKNDLNDLTEALNDYEAVTNATLQEHNYRIARLEGGDPARINSFTASPNICEMGGSENIILSWDIYGDVDMITINGEPVTGTSKTYANVREDTTYNLSVKDTKGNTLNSSVSVDFVNHLFWGVSDSPNQTEGAVKALDYTEMSDTRTRTIHVSPSNEYIYYAYPKRLGTSEFRVNGFTGGFENPVTVAIDNHSGYTEDYYVYRSVNKISGTLDVEII